MSGAHGQTEQEEDRHSAPFDRRLFVRLLREARGEHLVLFGCLGLVAISAGVDLALPWLTRIAIDQAITPTFAPGLTPSAMPGGSAAAPQAACELLRDLGVGLLLLLVLRLVLGYVQGLLLQNAGARIVHRLRQRVMGALLRQPMATFDRQAIGRLTTRATNDVNAVNDLFTGVVVYLVKDVAMIVGILALLIILDWRLTCWLAILLPLLAGLSWWFHVSARDGWRRVRGRLSALNAHLQEIVNGIGIVQLFTHEPRARRDFAELNAQEFDAGMALVRLFGAFWPLVAFIGTAAAALILWRGGANVVAGLTTIGTVVAFLAYTEMLFAPIRDLADKHNLIQAAMAAAERIYGILDAPTESSSGRPVVRSSGRLPAAAGVPAMRVEFCQVWFAYREPPAADGGSVEPEWVLQDVSFVIEPGHQVALVGPTGSGKTTIAALVQRFYLVQRGRVLVDGRDVRDWDLAELRQRFAVVPQDVWLFAGSIAENLALRDVRIPRERLALAAKSLGADEAITRQAEGLDTVLSDRGGSLSTGERQLLALARAGARAPALLILDEATAHVDSHTEQLVQRGLTTLLTGRTALIIAHRLSTIEHADRILVLHHGRLVQQGTHGDLQAQDGLYRRLHRRQAVAEAVGE